MAPDKFDASQLLQTEFADHILVAQATAGPLAAPFTKLVDMLLEALRGGHKLLLFGNGGSAADAQHWATELTVRYRAKRPAIAALALTTDSSALTAIGNDLGFEQIFARQIEALGRPGDVAIAISTSGDSPNVLAAVAQARAMGCRTVAFTGKGGGKLAPLVDLALIVPSNDTARIQEMHAILGHAMCGALEVRMGGM